MTNIFDTKIITGVDRPDLLEAADLIAQPEWPEFMLHDPVAGQYWGDLYTRFPEYQFALVREDTGDLIVAANSVPVCWKNSPDDLPEEGWDWVFEHAVQSHKKGDTPNIQCALQIVVAAEYKGRGLSTRMINEMKAIGHAHGLKGLLAPVRPNHKHRFPLVPMSEYITWTNRDNLPFDPWLRVHARLGARIVKPCHKAMTIPGTVTQWREWTGLKLERSGQYIVPNALNPIEIDIESDTGLYLEPNVWACHPPLN